MLKNALLILLVLLGNVRISSQDTLKIKKIKILPVPALGYSPETRTYLGAVSLFTLDFYNGKTRTSNAKLEFNYTWNKQVILESGWNYFFRDEKWFTKGLLHYSKYPDLYYGIGSNTPDSNKLTFNSRRFVVEASALKNVGPQLFFGLGVKYIKYSEITFKSTKTIFPELIAGNVLGAGLTLLNDSRNNLLTPTRGRYVLVNSSYNFSKNNYTEFTFDFRIYKSWHNNITLASRFINKLNTNNPPFFDLAYLGGDKYVRGYYYGRFRDRNLSSVQTELRLKVYRWFGMTLFGGLSSNYKSANSFTFKDSKYNAGLGIRVLVDKKENTNLRFDYAIGEKGNSGFYISFGESF